MHHHSRTSKEDDGWTNTTLVGNPCGSNKAKDQVISVKKAKLKQGQTPTRVMAFSFLRMKKLVQDLNFDATASSVIASFVIETSSAAFCLWLRVNESLNLRPNQVVQSKKDECQVSCHEATLCERKSVSGVSEAQARKVRSRDCEPAVGMKNRYAKRVPACEQEIRRRLQDDYYVFPHTDENGNVDPKVSVPKEKRKKWLRRWSKIAGAGTKTLGLIFFHIALL